jgi:large subunit ribosomal protein L10
MARAEKQAAVAEIVDSFNDAVGAVLTDYRGLTVKELQDLRRSLGEHADYAVVKNTLAKLAASEAGMTGFDELLIGPTAIAFLNGDVVEAAKGLRDFAKAHPALIIKGGYLDGRAIDAKEVAKLADLESREVLLSKMAGAMLASLQNAVVLFNAPIAQVARLAGALQAKAEQDPSILAGGDSQETSTAPAEPAAEEAAEAPEETTVDETPQAEASADADEVPAAEATEVAEAPEETTVDETPEAEASADADEVPAAEATEGAEESSDEAAAETPSAESDDADETTTEA